MQLTWKLILFFFFFAYFVFISNLFNLFRTRSIWNNSLLLPRFILSRIMEEIFGCLHPFHFIPLLHTQIDDWRMQTDFIMSLIYFQCLFVDNFHHLLLIYHFMVFYFLFWFFLLSLCFNQFSSLCLCGGGCSCLDLCLWNYFVQPPTI